MFEIIVGLIALVFLYRVFQKRNEADQGSSILPFLDEEFRKNQSKSENDYYDWEIEANDGFRSSSKDPIDEAGDDFFDEEPFHHD